MTGIDKKILFDVILSHVSGRTGLTAEEQRYFCSLLNVRTLLHRQYLVQQGEICKYESYVCKGFLRSFLVDEQGMDHTMHFAMEDWWISDLTSFIKQQAATLNIVALEPSTVLQISKENLEKLLTEIPAFERFWRTLNENSYMASEERIYNNLALSGAARYEALLLKYPSIEQRLPQKHIASYLGITPVFLSQIRARNVKRP